MLAILLCAATLPSTTLLSIDSNRVVRQFDPQVAFGAGLDGHERGENRAIFSPKSVKAMKSAGFQRFTYRLRTELAGEAWHWNPSGSWSDPGRREGYWTSTAKPGKAISVSYGYRLPRRGNTIDQANNDDYSRINDGDRSTFWKSNPYLDPAYGGEDYASRPQWIVVDLGRPKPIDTIRIDWGNPFASAFELQYWDGPNSLYPDQGSWQPFLSRDWTGNGGTSKLAVPKIAAQFVRILLKRSACHPGGLGKDRRDRLGFAVRELWIGQTDSQGDFEDWVDHSKRHDNQSYIFVSSTDPWHRQQDIDRKVEQPGFDLYFRSALLQGHQSLMAVPALYDTPENVAAGAKWLKARKYPVAGFEIGEEPDGQVATAENYAELYLLMANRIRSSYAKADIGGPSFQTVTIDFRMFPGLETPWLGRFVQFLKDRGRLNDFAFCSFEWYPFDDVNIGPARQLPSAPTMLGAAVARLQNAGLGGIPWIVTEYGFSAFGAEAEVDLPGAIFNFDCALSTIRLGGRTSYLYGLEPNELIEEKPPGWGNNMMFMKELGNEPLPIYYAARLMNGILCSSNGIHQLLGCNGETSMVGCYPVKRPDGTLSIALLNRSPVPTSVELEGNLPANWYRWEYSPNQYRWHAAMDDGHPALDLKPSESLQMGSSLVLPGYSITVLSSTRRSP